MFGMLLSHLDDKINMPGSAGRSSDYHGVVKHVVLLSDVQFKIHVSVIYL